jgi:hypothetical protein
MKAASNKYTGYFASDNETDGIENATHNTFPMKSWISKLKHPDVLWKCIVGCIFQFRRAHYHSRNTLYKISFL